MNKSPLFGRRIHIAGSISEDLTVASTQEVEAAIAFVKNLVIELIRKGANFVIPVDADKKRANDNSPICFDWIIWKTIATNLTRRPAEATNPLAIAVQHHKTEEQIPSDHAELWDDLKGSELISIENASHWNMASKRMEIQAHHGDILITIGGTEGVLFLANLYHESGKPVIPLNFKINSSGSGSIKLFNQALNSQQTHKFFKTEPPQSSHSWINRLNFPQRALVPQRVTDTISLLESLARPTVFAVRLLNPQIDGFSDVEDFFTGVVQHVVEIEMGYKLLVIDGKQANEHSRIDEAIFQKLHRASVVIADITGERPNCFIELGYALGKSIPVMMTAKQGTRFPFDVASLPGHAWKPTITIEDRRKEFRSYWTANINRPPLVNNDPLVP